MKQFLLAFFAVGIFLSFLAHSYSIENNIPQEENDLPQKIATGFERELSQLVQKLAPSVICVQALPDPEATDMFRRQGGGGGSGVIIHPDGYALSNFHVTEYGPIAVGMVDGRLRSAQVIAKDETADIVLIKIDGGPFEAVTLGDSDQVKEGDLTIAMGNPFHLAVDYKPTTTLGILSGTNRYLDGEGHGHTLIYSGILQTDTSINPGNSGGPLFDRQGRLIGINGRISTSYDRKVSVGVGYSIPINMIKYFLPSLFSGKDIDHGVLGVVLEEKEGIFIKNVIEDSPADHADLKEGDLIKSVEGREPQDLYDFIHKINGRAAGDIVTMQVARDSEDFKLHVKLAPRPLPSRLARNAQPIEFEKFDFTLTKPFIESKSNSEDESQKEEGKEEKGKKDLLEKILKKARQVNTYALDLTNYRDGLVWMRLTTTSPEEARYNPLSRGFVSSDVIQFFRGYSQQLIRRQDSSVIYPGLTLTSYNHQASWVCSNRHRPSELYNLDQKKHQKHQETLQSRLCWLGQLESSNWSITLEDEMRELKGRSCYVLTQRWKKDQITRRYIDSIEGVEVAQSRHHSDLSLIAHRDYTQLVKLGDKVLALAWEDRDVNGNFKASVEILKVSYDMDLDPLIFSFQPSLAF